MGGRRQDAIDADDRTRDFLLKQESGDAVQRQASWMRPSPSQGHVGTPDHQPLREQLRRRRKATLIEEKLAELDYASAPGFLINGLKREEPHRDELNDSPRAVL